MATVTRASIRDILLALLQQLSNITGIDPSRVYLSVLPEADIPHFSAQQDIVVQVGDEEPDIGIIDGAGRVDNRRRRRGTILVRTFMVLDQAGQDGTHLTDAALGHIVLEDLAVDAAELFVANDANSNDLNVPMRVGRISKPKRGQSKGWVESGIDFEFEYSRNLDQSRQ